MGLSYGCPRGLHSPQLVPQPDEDSRLLPLLVCLRFLFVPLFMLCHVPERARLPILFPQDAYFITFMLLFAVSNGYLVSLTMCLAPRSGAGAGDGEGAWLFEEGQLQGRELACPSWLCPRLTGATLWVRPALLSWPLARSWEGTCLPPSLSPGPGASGMTSGSPYINKWAGLPSLRAHLVPRFSVEGELRFSSKARLMGCFLQGQWSWKSQEGQVTGRTSWRAFLSRRKAVESRSLQCWTPKALKGVCPVALFYRWGN